MYKVRLWSARHAHLLKVCYEIFESVLSFLHPLFIRVGYQHVDPAIMSVEKSVKKFLFDSQSCGQCILGSAGMVCPMNCPKTLRNGPCGGVRADGNCEVKPEMLCVWVSAWEGSQKLSDGEKKIQIVQPAVDFRRKNTSAWLWEIRNRRKTRPG